MGLADRIKNDLPKAPHILTLPLLTFNHFGDRIYGQAMRRFKASIPSLDPERMIVDMANYAIEHVPYYRDKYKGLRIESAEQFRKEFDFIDKNTIRSAPEKFISDTPGKYITVSTSGSTGTPLKMLMPANRYVTEMAFVTRAWEMQGWTYGRRASIRMERMPEGRKFHINPVTKEFIFDGVERSDDYVRMIHRTMRRHNVRDIYAYSMSAFQILKQMQALGLDLSFLRNLILTSEAVSELQYRFLHEELGLNIICHYGHTEKLVCARSLTGYDHYMVEPAYGYTELIDFSGAVPADASAEGGYGEIVGSTLYNRAMPLLRYRTADSALSGGIKKDIDGIDKLLLTRIDGRSDKGIFYRHDGSVISEPAMIFHGEILSHIDGLQYVQDKRGYLRCIIRPNALFNDKDMDELRHKLSTAMLGHEYYTIETHGNFIIQPNGKFLLTVNNTL